MKMEKFTILVTGGLGTIGKPLVEELRRRGHTVWVCEPYHTNQPNFIRCDVSYFRQLERLFESHRFDYVYHMAAEFGRKSGEEFYETIWKTNAIGTRNLLQMQEKYKFRLIYPGSSEVYGKLYSGVMTEDIPEKVAVRLGNDYAISKWVNEMQIMNSIENTGTETVRVRFSNIYGPGEYYTNYRSVICLFIYRALHNMPYTVYTGDKRAFLYIDDAIHTFANICERFESGQIYNISNRDMVNMKQVSDIILKAFGQDDRLVEYKEVDKTATLVKDLDNSKAIRDLDHKKTISLEEGLTRTIEWQKKVYGFSK